jgi:uncharacterized delta-60 repeat protein
MSHTALPCCCRALALGLALTLSSSVVASNGIVDPTFGTNGVLFVDSGNTSVDRINGLLPSPDGGAWATGSLSVQTNGGSDLALLKLTADGKLDDSFGSGGITGIATDGVSDSGFALARAADGKLLVAGRLHSGAYSDWVLARFNANGSLDTSFGEPDGMGGRRGFVRHDVAPDNFTNDQAIDLAIQSTGKIVVAGEGYTYDGNFKYRRFAMLRFDANGDLDTSFGDNGVVIAAPLLFQIGEDVTGIAKRADGSLPPDDSITLVGYLSSGQGAVIRRFLANGAPDPAFNGNGTLRITDTVVNSQRTGIARIDAGRLQTDGKLVVVGTANERGFVFLRYLANGSLDTSFGSNGRRLVKFSPGVEYDEPAALALLTDGRIAAAGYATGSNDGIKSEDFAAAQLLPDGQPDPEFGDSLGRAVYPLSLRRDQALALSAMPRGGLLLAGFASKESAQADNDAVFVRTRGDDRIFRNGFE